MNNKITFPELVDTIAELTNTSKRVSELFLKELFGVIKERLEQGETVRIKNLGTFKVTEIAARKSVNVNTGEEMEIPAHRRVGFTPDKSLAEAINMPFEGFETVMLDDDISEDDLKELADVEDVEIPSVEDNQEVELAQVEEPQPPEFKEPEVPIVEKEEIAVEPEDDNENEVEEQAVTEVAEAVAEPEETPTLDEPVYDDDDDFEEEVKSEKRKSFIWGFIGGIVTFIVIGLVAIAVCDSCFGDFVPKNSGNVADLQEQNEQITDTVAEKQDTIVEIGETLPKIPEVVTDTVRQNYFLTKMSRKYYGRYEFWVYIYEENKEKIKNPNKVAPGLVVVIPPAEKYGIDKDNPESVQKAKNLAEKIL